MKHSYSMLSVVTRVLCIVIIESVFGLAPHARAQSSALLEDYLEIELTRVDEAYALVEQFGQQVWPGWTNYLEPEFYVDFPNGVHLLVARPGRTVEGYERVAGRSIRGNAVYVHRKDIMPIPLRQPLGGGGNGGESVRIRLTQWQGTPETNLQISSEKQILIGVHELFHCFQHRFPSFEAIGDQSKTAKNPSGTFTVDLNYAKWSSVEGRALLGAHDAKDVREVREYMKDYLVARREKQKGMPPAVIATEQEIQNSEGTAEYSNTKMAMIVRDAKYKGTANHGGDSFFRGFAHMDDYLQEELQEGTKQTMDMTMDTLVKYYKFGALESFALDRLSRGWKKNFLASGKTLDDVVSDVLRLKPADEERIKGRLAAKYNTAEVEAKHRATLEKRDQALALIAGRKGRHYVVDFSKLGKSDIVAIQYDYSKPNVRLGIHVIHPHGAGLVTLGEVEIAYAYVPVESFLRTWDWIDTEAKPGEKGYELKAGSQDGDVLKDVTFTTKGFTLKAPEVQIVEDKEKDEVRVLILSKVKR
jgi:hypothetical protein